MACGMIHLSFATAVAAYALFQRAGDCPLNTRKVGRERLTAGVLATPIGDSMPSAGYIAMHVRGKSAAQSKTGTSTTLTVTAGGNAVSSSAGGGVVTLTAQVNANGAAVIPGQGNFCDASAKTCQDVHLRGTAQPTSGRTATLKLRTGIGSHN